MSLPVIAVFDIGKTNKKFFLFDQQYCIVHEQIIQFDETNDEDGFRCDDAVKLSLWVTQVMKTVLQMPAFDIKAVNFSAYGASFCHVGSDGNLVTPLYNYLKPLPAALQQRFYQHFGGEINLSVETASPVLGNLNSGMQLYALQQEKKELFDQIRYSLHLPQYISWLVTGNTFAEIASIGCHTLLWDFTKHMYHAWVYETGIIDKFPSIVQAVQTTNINLEGKEIAAGVGLHDSSAALIPYLRFFSEPFILISTGTWCISLNPFTSSPLTKEELAQDCLCYLDYTGKPVKAARLFAGHEHEEQVKRLASHFKVPVDHYKKIAFDKTCVKENEDPATRVDLAQSGFQKRSLEEYPDYATAYHQLMSGLVRQQKKSTSLVLDDATGLKKIFVDGGFATNPVYLHLLAAAFPQMEVYAADVSQASAIGAAMAIHDSWNQLPINKDLVRLHLYKSS